MHLKIAEWGGLSYYIVKEESPTSHIVLVKDGMGKTSVFNLESRLELMNTTFSQGTKDLDVSDRKKALEFMREFQEDFIDYWNEITRPLN